MLKKISVLVMPMLMAVCTVVQAGELEIYPTLAVQEEDTDNVFETNSNRESDFISRFIPGFSLTYKAPVLEGDIRYLFDYRYYAKSRDDDITHTLSANGHLTVIENLFFLDMSDNYQRVSLDITRDVTQESLFIDQTDRNIAIISPNLVLRPNSRAEVKLGYRFLDTRYTNDNLGINNIDNTSQTTGSLGINKMEHMGFLQITYELSPKWYLTADYDFVRQTSDLDDLNHHLANGGIRYEYAEKSFLFAKAGNTWINYDSGKRMSNFFWHAGVTHTFPTLVTTLVTGVKYDEDPLSTITRETYVKGNVNKEFINSAVGGSLFYSEFARADTGKLDTRKYGGEIHARHEFGARLSGKVAFAAENYEQPLIPGKTRRLIAETGLSYKLAEQLTVSLSYIYVDYYSRTILSDNRHVNRGIFEVQKFF